MKAKVVVLTALSFAFFVATAYGAASDVTRSNRVGLISAAVVAALIVSMVILYFRTAKRTPDRT